MGEEEKVVETTEEVKTEEKGKKAKKDVKKPDMGAALGQAKSLVGSGKSFLTKFFGENKSRGKLVLTIMFGFQALLAFQSGFVFFLLAVLIAVVGFVGLSAVVPAEAKEEETKPEE